MPYHYCYEVYHGNCFLCSGIYCIGLAEFVKDKMFWDNYSYENL